MKIRIGSIVLTIAVLLVIGLLYFHYQDIGIMENLFGFSLVTLFGISMVYLSIRKWKDPLNPVSLYFPFIFGFGFSLMSFSALVKPYNYFSVIVILLSIVCYLGGAFANISFKSPFHAIRFTPKSNLLIYFLILSISLFSFAIEVANIGYLPVMRMFSFDVYNDSMYKLVSFIHYFAMLFAIFPAWTYIMYMRGNFRKKWVIFVCLLSFFVIVNYLSRQTILLLFLSLLITISYYHVINFKKLFLYALGGFLFFFIIGNVRIAQNNSYKHSTGITPTSFLRVAAGIKYKTNLVESTYVLYSSFRYDAFNEFVKKARHDNYHGMGKFVFRQLISLAFIDKVGLVDYDSTEYKISSNISTYATDPYLDFGILGVIVFGFFYGLITNHFYENYKSGREQYIISWSVIIFCIIMMPFMNYFSTFFVFLVWGANKLIISDADDSAGDFHNIQNTDKKKDITYE